MHANQPFSHNVFNCLTVIHRRHTQKNMFASQINKKTFLAMTKTKIV